MLPAICATRSMPAGSGSAAATNVATPSSARSRNATACARAMDPHPTIPTRNISAVSRSRVLAVVPTSEREAEHPGRVAADDRADVIVGDAVELVGVARLRVGPCALGVGVVVAPHERVEAGGLTVVDRDRVVHERRRALAPDELARKDRQ